jgi:ribosomal protein S18 acetylase RimI-like enzyme
MFLAEMLMAAAFWRADGPAGSLGEVMAQPELAHYVAGWPRPRDMGVVAEAGHPVAEAGHPVAEAGHPVGAAWLRFFPENDPGYGFVDAGTPEVSVGVAHQWRGLGVGTRLLSAILAQARGAGLTTLSLSVEPDNQALRLYGRLGFQKVGEVGGSLTMLLRL